MNPADSIPSLGEAGVEPRPSRYTTYLIPRRSVSFPIKIEALINFLVLTANTYETEGDIRFLLLPDILSRHIRKLQEGSVYFTP